jgi:hypothetical protein
MLDDTMDARASGALPDERFVDVRYSDLMEDPAGTVGRIHDRLGIDAPPQLRAAVADYVAARPKDARGTHRYSLADTGLDPVTERDRFSRYQAAYAVPDEV